MHTPVALDTHTVPSYTHTPVALDTDTMPSYMHTPALDTDTVPSYMHTPALDTDTVPSYMAPSNCIHDFCILNMNSNKSIIYNSTPNILTISTGTQKWQLTMLQISERPVGWFLLYQCHCILLSLSLIYKKALEVCSLPNIYTFLFYTIAS